MSTKKVPVMKRHEALRARLIELIGSVGAEVPADELLAIAAYLVGQLVAMQDQRTITPALAMEIVARNIEEGNAHTINSLLNAPGGNA